MKILEKESSIFLAKEAYEHRDLINFFIIPVMYLLGVWGMMKVILCSVFFNRPPKVGSIFFDDMSPTCGEIRKGVATWRALDILYNHRFGVKGRLTDFWLSALNAKAIRNRLKLVRRELRNIILSFAESEVRIVSIASGSAQAIIEVLAELRRENRHINVRVIAIDLDPTALAYSKALADKYRVSDSFTFFEGSTNNTLNNGLVREFDPHIVEMVGFLDYRPEKKAISLIERIHSILKPGGVLLTANIKPNPESFFLKWIINWRMIYRRPSSFKKIVAKGGFENIRLVYEPLGIHGVVVAKKN